MNQRRRHRRIDAAAKRAEHPAVADLFADLFDRSFDEMLHRPVGLATADTKNEIVEDLPPARRVRHFGMKLHAEEAPRRIGESSDGRIGAVGKTLPSLGKRRHLVAMAHPHPRQFVLGKTVKQIGVVVDDQVGGTILALIGAGDFASKG